MQMNLDPEQKQVLDYALSKKNCCVIGAPGTGKTEIFNALGENLGCSAAFLPFTRAARKELVDRLSIELSPGGSKVLPSNIEVKTVNAFCQSYLSGFNGYDEQLTDFLRLKGKPSFSLVGIDEVQDNRPVHFKVAKSVMQDWIFAGGDPHQTIFTFGDAMGNSAFKELEDLGCKTFTLHNNYRSSPEIVGILNKLVNAEMVSKGPKTYNRSAVFARTHQQLEYVSLDLEKNGVPHTVKTKDHNDKVVLGGSDLFLMVIHACKGLGFDTVYQFDWRAPYTPNLDENKNLLYVSISRASKEFYLVDCKTRNHGGKELEGTDARQISRVDFLNRLK
jgi:superfamily I DNA/RNA helicase